MKFIIDGPGDVYIHTQDLAQIKKVLSYGPEHWEGGAGDSAINLEGKRDCLIFFKTDKGIFIEHLPKVTTPLIKKKQSQKLLLIMLEESLCISPDVCLMDEETAYKIMAYFISHKGLLHPDFEWVHRVKVIPEAYKYM